MPEEYKGLHNKVDELNKELHILQNTNSCLVDQLNRQNHENTKLREKLQELESRLDAKQENFLISTPKHLKKNLLIGSSMLRDVRTSDSNKLNVISSEWGQNSKYYQ